MKTSVDPSEVLVFALLGLASAALYGGFWFFRHFVKRGGFLESLSDFVYVILAGGGFVLCLMFLTDGRLSIFYFLAYLSGLILALLVLNKFKLLLSAFFKGLYRKTKDGKILSFFKKRAAAVKAYETEKENKRVERDKKYREERKKKEEEREKERKKREEERNNIRLEANKKKEEEKEKKRIEKEKERIEKERKLKVEN
ncbi:MAG: hypothetical protein LBT20_05765 [Clostridiales bacterium]|jgi:flagellar biosynthesis GTPase FlhF|nr:hypothetical protein [Clostridiales bacterium]